jgi:diacylglycerol O-acyltransferase
MLEAFPYVPLAGSVRIGIAIFSYDGTLNFGVTGDYDSATDIGVLADGIESGLAELLRIAEKAGAGKKAPARSKKPARSSANGRRSARSTSEASR